MEADMPRLRINRRTCKFCRTDKTVAETPGIRYVPCICMECSRATLAFHEAHWLAGQGRVIKDSMMKEGE